MRQDALTVEPTRALGQAIRYEQFGHGADVGVRGFGATASEAFERAAMALFSLLAEDPSRLGREAEERFEVEAPGLPELLVAFLNELISLADTKHLVFGDFRVRIDENPSGSCRLSARARGEPFDAARHRFTVLPKGATYTALAVGRQDGRWVAQCVIDV